MTKEDEELGQSPVPEGDPDRSPVAVDLTDLDDDDDKAPEPAANTPEGRKGRRTQLRETREKARQADERVQTLERQIAELRGAVSRPQPVYVQTPQEQGDPADAQIEGIWEQQQLLLRTIQSPQATEDDVNRASKAWRQLDKQRRQIEVGQVIASRQPSEAVTEDRVVNQMLTSEFPEIFQNNEPMRLRAMAEMTDLLTRGKPKSIATAREACERVLAAHGIRKPKAPAPTASQQARYTSVSRAGAGGASNGGQYVPSQNVLRTARAYTDHIPNLSDEERVRRWIKEVGRPNGLV